MKTFKLVHNFIIIVTLIALSISTIYADPGSYHHVSDCEVCHDQDEYTDNLGLVREVITTPDGADRNVVFTAYTGQNSYADGDEIYNGICEICHTSTSYHRNDGSDNMQHFDGEYCVSCHLHINEFAVFGDSTDGSRSGSSSSGGASGASGESIENILIPETEREYVYKDSRVSYHFNSEGNIIGHVNFTGLMNSGNIAVKIEILKNISALVDHSPDDIAYKYLNILVAASGWASPQNIANPKISFKVEKTWVDMNNIDRSSIRMNRYNNKKWNPLVTTMTGQDDDYLYFESETPGFSPFVITAKVFESEAVEGGVADEPTAEYNVSHETTAIDKGNDTPGFSLFICVFVLLTTMVILGKRKN